MSVNGGLSYDQVTVVDLVAEAASWPLSLRLADTVVTETLEAIRDAVANGVVEHAGLSEVIWDRTEDLLAAKTAH
jgi:hypothetical protein